MLTTYIVPIIRVYMHVHVHVTRDLSLYNIHCKSGYLRWW